MSDIKWIKITTDIFDDEKILLIESMPSADSIITIWFKLLTLAGKQNNSGVFILNDKLAYTDEMLATIFRRDVNTVRLALNTFEKFGMIDIVDGVITIPNWGKHQNLDSIENKREYMKKYMKEKREKQKEIACKTNSKTNSKANSKTNVSRAEEEIDNKEEDKEYKEDNKEEDKKERDKEDNKEKDKKSDGNTNDNERIVPRIVDESYHKESKKRFIPPTVAEVKEYCKEKGYIVDAETFVNFYESKGWYIGKNKMVSWRSAVATWEKKERENPRNQQALSAKERFADFINGGKK